MRVKATRSKFKDCPPEIAAFGSPESDTDISVGTQYEVYAVSTYQGVVSFQIVSDVEMITWLPAWFFEVCDSSIPDDWICNIFPTTGQLVLGPDFVAASEFSYSQMVEVNEESAAKFWRRTKVRPIRSRNET